MIDYEKLFFNYDSSIRDAMDCLTKTSEKILFVIGSKKQLLGTVTDGDIRRWILTENSLSEPVRNVMNKKPIVATKEDGLEAIKQLMLIHKLECIPQVNEDGIITAAYTFRDILSDPDMHIVKKKIDTPVVIMAGGKGGRLKPFTDILPKPLIPVGDKPVIEKIMNIFHSYGVKDFLITLNYRAGMVKAYFSEHSLPYSLDFVLEKDPLGTVGSLSLLKERLSSTFFITNCDIIIKADYSDIFNFHKRDKNTLTIVCSMKHFKIPYGVVYHENNGKFRHMKEKPEMDFLVNTGVYIAEPEVLKLVPENIKYDMNSLIDRLKENDKRIGIYPVSDRSWFDIGQWEEYHSSMKILEKEQ